MRESQRSGNEWAVVAHENGKRWHFDFADSFEEARAKFDEWNARADREWPSMRFSLERLRGEGGSR